ncbi:hypothetical protein ACQUJT_06630 [Ralstonia pseudosolanacearum]
MPQAKLADDIRDFIPLVRKIKLGTLRSELLKDDDVTTNFTHAFDADGNLRPRSANTSAAAAHNKLDAIRATHPDVIAEFEAAMALPSILGDQKAQIAREIEDLLPLIADVKAGASLNEVRKREGVSPSFVNYFDPYGNLKPRNSKSAVPIHNKLDAIRNDYPNVVRQFLEMVARPSVLGDQETPDAKDAKEIKALTLIAREIKTGVPPTTVGKRIGKRNLLYLFNADGTLKAPTENRRATALHNTLKRTRKHHPDVAEAFEKAVSGPMARGRQNVRKAKIAREIRGLIPLAEQLKAGASMNDIKKGHELGSILEHAFYPDGNLKPRTVPGAVAIHNKLAEIGEDYPNLVRNFKKAVAGPFELGDAKARNAAIAQDIEALLPWIEAIKAGESPTTLGKRIGMPALRYLFSPDGCLKAPEDNASAAAFHTRLESIRTDYPELGRTFDALRPRNIRTRRAAAGPADDAKTLPPASWLGHRKRGERPRRSDKARTASHAPAQTRASAASPPAPKPEPMDTALRPSLPRGPIYVEAELDQARTAFYRELGSFCDLTGEQARWRAHFDRGDAVVVRHSMTPVPENEHKFPLRDPADPLRRAHPRYAGPDGKCHPNVEVSKVQLNTGFRSYLRQLAKSDDRFRVDSVRLGEIMDQLERDAARELQRLIDERPAALRCQPRVLQPRDVLAHERALIGQYGLFVQRPQSTEPPPTLSNGRILGFYMGALVENDLERIQTETAHPDYARYAIDAHPFRGRTAMYSGLGAANGIAFANTALQADAPEPAYDHRRLNALFVEFEASLTDKENKRRREHLVAMVALDNLYDSPALEAQVLVDYGDAFLGHFKTPAPSAKVKTESN